MPAARSRGRTVDDRSPPAAPPRNDAYTVLLIISLVAMLVGTLFLYMDLSAYGPAKPPAFQPRPPLSQTPGAGQQAPPAGGQNNPPPAGNPGGAGQPQGGAGGQGGAAPPPGGGQF